MIDKLETIRNLTDKGTITPARRERINTLVRDVLKDLPRILAEHDAMRERLAEVEEIHGEQGKPLTWRANGKALADRDANTSGYSDEHHEIMREICPDDPDYDDFNGRRS